MNVGIVSNGKNVPDKNNIGKVTTLPAASASSSSRTTVEIIMPIPGNVNAPDMMSIINNGFRTTSILNTNAATINITLVEIIPISI